MGRGRKGVRKEWRKLGFERFEGKRGVQEKLDMKKGKWRRRKEKKTDRRGVMREEKKL